MQRTAQFSKTLDAIEQLTQELIEQWIRFTEGVKDEPGFLGAALHKSTDGTRVVNYAQWRSDADLDSFVKKYSAQFDTRRRLASRIDPHRYEVVYLYDQPDS